jgi:sec-independent protein translocase protein TatA
MVLPLGALVMNIAGSEWIIIVLLALVLLFGAKRLPQFSKTIGRAVGEYEKARQKFQQEMQEATEQVGRDTGVNPLPRITGPVNTEREKLEMMANSLGIEHAGKGDEELRSLISRRMNA